MEGAKMAQIGTYFAIAMIAIGFGIASCAIQSIILWLWTLSRPASAPVQSWMKLGQYYRGEISPGVNIRTNSGDGTWKLEAIPPHEHLHHRSEVLRGIRIDTLQIAFGVALIAAGIYVAVGWSERPGTTLSLILLIPSLIIAIRLRINVALADPEYPERNLLIGGIRGGMGMALVGLATLVA